jgi:hypothetical protein
VVILHETEEALTRALELCDRIMEQCWEHVELDIGHWSMELLSMESCGLEATHRAARADILVVAAEGQGAFPDSFKDWTRQWLDHRAHREGVLVGLFHQPAEQEGETASRDIHLRQLALRAGMDYLRRLPQAPPHGIPDFTEWCAARASAQTGTLSQIVRNTPKEPR